MSLLGWLASALPRPGVCWGRDCWFSVETAATIGRLAARMLAGVREGHLGTATRLKALGSSCAAGSDCRSSERSSQSTLMLPRCAVGSCRPGNIGTICAARCAQEWGCETRFPLLWNAQNTFDEQYYGAAAVGLSQPSQIHFPCQLSPMPTSPTRGQNPTSACRVRPLLQCKTMSCILNVSCTPWRRQPHRLKQHVSALQASEAVAMDEVSAQAHALQSRHAAEPCYASHGHPSWARPNSPPSPSSSPGTSSPSSSTSPPSSYSSAASSSSNCDSHRHKKESEVSHG